MPGSHRRIALIGAWITVLTVCVSYTAFSQPGGGGGVISRSTPWFWASGTAAHVQGVVAHVALGAACLSMGAARDAILCRGAADRLDMTNGGALETFRVYTSTTKYIEMGAGISPVLQSDTASNLALNGGAGAVVFQSNGTAIAQVSSTTFEPTSNGLIDLGEAGVGFKRLYVDYTNTGTVGAVTINKAAMRINMGSNAASLVVTDSLVTAASHVFCQSGSRDGLVRGVTPAAGSFTVYVHPQSQQTAYDCLLINAD